MGIDGEAREGSHEDFTAWLAHGIEHEYCSPVTCTTHDGFPPTARDLELAEEGIDDPCVVAVRLSDRFR